MSSPPTIVAPARVCALLPDDRFFAVAVPVETGEAAGPVAAQVELALEASSPFPLAQLYYGFFTRPGATRALAYATYRRRFTAEESAAWGSADLVLPTFAALLSVNPPPAGATTWLIAAGSGLTAVHFDDDSGVPAVVRTAGWPEEASDADRAAARDGLLRSLPGSRTVVDLPAPELDPTAGEVLRFRAGEVQATIPSEEAATLDVRDKLELAALGRAQARDRWLWRGFAAAVAILAFSLLLEVIVVGGRGFLASRRAERDARAPEVAEIMTKQALATRIDEMASKRLLPIEMILAVNSARPPSIQFVSTSTIGLTGLEISAQTGAQGDIDAFESAVRRLPACDRVEIRDLVSRSGVTTFVLAITFKPDGIRPAGSTNE